LHVQEPHFEVLQPSITSLQATVGALDAQQEHLFNSVYNESIAIATRKGAPVTSYSIDRRCMTNYTEDLIREDTCALICFVCARRFPHVSQKQNMTTKRIQLLSRVDQSESEAVRFCGLTRKQIEHIFGLSTYVQKYCKHNDEVHLN
jgi:hypothetical protein